MYQSGWRTQEQHVKVTVHPPNIKQNRLSNGKLAVHDVASRLIIQVLYLYLSATETEAEAEMSTTATQKIYKLKVV